MKYFPRRSFLKSASVLPILYALGCSKKATELVPEPVPLPKEKTAAEISGNGRWQPGYLSIVQGPSSDTKVSFNIFAPRLKKYVYKVISADGGISSIDLVDSIMGPGLYKIDKLKCEGLSLGQSYLLQAWDGKTLIDERTFSTLDISKSNPRFALLSCMCDDYRFNEVIDPMWERLREQKPDFLILNGDAVYVDSFEFVERKKATESDLWQRYIDSFKRIPLYHWKNLVPIFSTWDDHDYGTNDGDREFVSKEAALKLYHGIFSGVEIPGVWALGPGGVSSVLTAFGQTFYFMDDRTFRQPNKNQTEQEEYGHWGQGQHEWLLNNLKANSNPSWIVNGNQCFNGKDYPFKETFEGNDPKEFSNFIEQLKQISSPVVFASGDVHLSEIMQIPKDRIGYQTYEFTSSSMHSYAGGGWENPLRIDGAYCEEFNFFIIKSKNEGGQLKVEVSCLGLAKSPYFESSYTVSI